MNALPRNRDWWRAIEHADPARQPQTPAMIADCVLTPFGSLDGLAAALAGRLQGREATLIRSVASFDGFDTFPAFSVHAKGSPGEAGRQTVDTYVCAIAVQKIPADAVLAAIAEAQQAQARDTAA